MQDEFLAAFATMSEAIHQAHDGHTQWFSIYMDNLIYRPLFGKSAGQLRAMYGLPKQASSCSFLPDEALQEMIRRMVVITEQLQSGKKYPEIKEFVLSDLSQEPLVFTLPPIPEKKRGQGRRRRPPTGGSAPLPGQLCLPGLE